jgi:hypothetical protein
MYETGKGVEQDYTLAVDWYYKAAAKGAADAQYNLGTMYEAGKGVVQDPRQAFEWYKKSAEQGYAPAQTSLGMMFAEGYGVLQDIRQAMSWYQKAADAGYAVAQSRLGDIYETKKETAKAIYWYRSAAEIGDSSAQTKLGLMYSFGQNLPKNPIIAYALLEMAVSSGNETAKDIYDVIAKGLIPAQIEQAKIFVNEPEKLWALIDTTLDEKMKK